LDTTGIVILIIIFIPISALSIFIGCIFSPNLRKKAKKHPILYLAWAIVSIVIIYIFILLGRPSRYDVTVKCMNNQKVIGHACYLYSENNNGKWPAQMADLIPTYLDNPRVINCPLTNKQYIYIQPSLFSPADTAVITCTQHRTQHEPMISVTLYKGGHVRIKYK